jgi:UDP-N-acetylglucosamine 2-epimerase (non-hydrolysing)
MLIDIIAGARPNFVKIAPIIDSINEVKKSNKNIEYRLIHTGQHYDTLMSGSFFQQLGIPKPDINLGSGGGTQAEQIAKIMVSYENVLLHRKPDLTLVVGDVNSTMACAITAKKMNVLVAHVEAGIRSGDWSMPEEINRIVTDSISDYFFTTTELASNNLIRNGIAKDKIFLVGNTMIDSLLKNEHKFLRPKIWTKAKLKKNEYLVLTLHRPSNVDNGDYLDILIREIISNSNKYPLIFPIHPRTARNFKSDDLRNHNFHVIDPLSYLEFNYLVKNAKAIITDSGGITEEATVMNIPCMTLRTSTERPETITLGTNELIGTNPGAITDAMIKLFDLKWKSSKEIPYWDGHSSERIVNIIAKLFNV